MKKKKNHSFTHPINPRMTAVHFQTLTLKSGWTNIKKEKPEPLSHMTLNGIIISIHHFCGSSDYS